MHYGISTICPSWFRSYITNRYQEVILHQPFTFLFFKSDHGHNNIIYLHIYNNINQILTPKFCKKKKLQSVFGKRCVYYKCLPFYISHQERIQHVHENFPLRTFFFYTYRQGVASLLYI